MQENLQQQIEQLRKENELLRSAIENNDLKAHKKREKRKKKLAWTWKLFTGNSLHDSFNSWFTEYHSDKKVSPNTSANLLTSLVKRFVRVRLLSLILLLFSLVPSLVSLFILVKQNSLIKIQNGLVEASRKSSYGFQLANIFDAIDAENGNLSNGLISRIVGLTNSLKPYKILENSELSKKSYSPERTQLLLFLINVVNKPSLNKIYDSADFSHCDLRNINLSGKYLAGINLENSNLENTELHRANLNNANLTKSNLKGIQFSNGFAKSAIFTNADLKDAKITRTDLTGANFTSANLNQTNINLSELNNAYNEEGRIYFNHKESEEYLDKNYQVKKQNNVHIIIKR